MSFCRWLNHDFTKACATLTRYRPQWRQPAKYMYKSKEDVGLRHEKIEKFGADNDSYLLCVNFEFCLGKANIVVNKSLRAENLVLCGNIHVAEQANIK